ncbi:MAG: D-glycero-beta-D-manno-heptose 1,7-bisphosphate 7-phosphatase [Victivallaceae bacterium]|nr:D-glycero-beta-D-manno-heptose 1,7-bisphosphate 7-phosphatase [Victivallaceae bacterium]
MKKCCFLDRDGVVNREVDYLSDPDKAVLEAGVGSAIRRMNEMGFYVIVVTNQSGVARGLYPESAIALVHAKIRELLAPSGARIDDFFYCPHHPDFSGPCECRKPNPGMLLAAAAKYGIDLSRSYMVGDRVSDLTAGERAHCRASILVRTGYGEKTLSKLAEPPKYVVDNLAAATDLIFQMDGPDQTRAASSGVSETA